MFPFLVKAKEKRAKAIEKADENYQALKMELEQSVNSVNLEYSHENDENNTLIIPNQPVEYFNKIFASPNYKMFVKYGLVAKKYQGVIDKFVGIAIGIIIVLSGILYLLTHSVILTVIVLIILIILLLLANKYLTKGETYKEFYERTIYGLIFMILPNYTVTNDKSFSVSSDVLRTLVKTNFDKHKISNSLTFSSDCLSGNLYNLMLQKDRQVKDSSGNYKTVTDKVFDGFSITLNYKSSFDFLKGAIINIRDDDNVLSAIGEDTVQSVYQSDKEFMFNSEELNKAFDCYIGGVNSFGDIDDLMQRIHMIITPTFEEQLLFLRKRFNTFNMTITDNMINFNVSMSKSSYQKLNSGEMLSLKEKYRDHIKKFELPISSGVGARDFMYYKMFPPAEELFFVIYFDNLIRTYLDKSNMKVENIELLKAFQTLDLETSETEYGVFKTKYKEDIEAIYEESKHIEIN